MIRTTGSIGKCNLICRLDLRYQRQNEKHRKAVIYLSHQFPKPTQPMPVTSFRARWRHSQLTRQHNPRARRPLKTELSKLTSKMNANAIRAGSLTFRPGSASIEGQDGALEFVIREWRAVYWSRYAVTTPMVRSLTVVSLVERLLLD